jgi:hypothetical protein
MLDSRRRIYALTMWTAEKRAKGWYIKRTDSQDKWRGPFTSETSACLMRDRV